MQLPPFRAVVLCDPAHYTVAEAANPHMVSNGQLNAVDPAQARVQWDALCAAYASLGIDVMVLPSVAAFPDQVFTANPVFCYSGSDGVARYIPARMRYPSRQGEVDLLAEFLETAGVKRADLPGQASFEGGGDLLWKGTERTLLGGHGFRSNLESITAAAELVDAPLVPLRLVDERFYHLDTCVAVLDKDTALWVPSALDHASQSRLQESFETLLEIPAAEAMSFAGNAHCPDGKHVILDADNQATAELLADHGFKPVLVDTSEFRKSGGSVYCMKQVIW